MNSDNRGLDSKYLSSRTLNVSIVPESTTFDGRRFHIFTTRLKKKCLASFVLKRLPTILKPLFLVTFERSTDRYFSIFIFVNPLKNFKKRNKVPSYSTLLKRK